MTDYIICNQCGSDLKQNSGYPNIYYCQNLDCAYSKGVIFDVEFPEKMKQEKLPYDEMLQRVLDHIQTAKPINLINIFMLFNKNVHVGYLPEHKLFVLNWGTKVGPGTGHRE